MKNIWEEVGEEELKDLSYTQNMPDSVIAEKFGISISQVRYKRKKYNISLREQMKENFINRDEKLFEVLNANAKARLLQKDNIEVIAKTLTHYLFRDGPVEDMHANNQLSQDDMKALNKFMVNKIAGLLITCLDGEWLKLELLCQYYKTVGKEWDKPEPDVEVLEALLDNLYYEIKKDT